MRDKRGVSACLAAWRVWVVWATALPVILLGALALVGWALGLDLLTRIISGRASMKPNTALALVLAGGALFGLARVTPRPWAVGAPAVVVLVIALATLIEYITGALLGIDEWLFRDPEAIGAVHPGRMAISTAVALLLTGATLLLAVLGARHAAAGRVARVLSGAIVAIGAMGLLGHVFEVVVLHTWYPFGSIALPTVTSIILLGFGLLAAPRAPAWAPRLLSEDQHITRVAVLALTLAAGTTGIAGVAALESHVRRSAEGELQSLLNAQVTELTTNLELRASRAEIVTTRPNLRRVLRILVAEPSNRDARQVVHSVLASFLSHDFSRLVASRPGGEEIASAGNDATAIAALDVPLDGSGRARLVWRDGVGLRHDLILTDAEGSLGTVVVEQRLPRITEMLTGNQTRFASAEFLLCSSAGPTFRCFPSRLSTTPVVVPPGQRGAPRLMQRALAEGAGVSTTVDYRGNEVFGAYRPLPTLGLVAVLKVDVDELYGPARRQLGLALLLVVIVTLGGVALVRARVGRLATHLEQRVQQRTTDLEQANARLSILHEIDRGLIAAKNLEGIAETTLRQLRDLLGVSRVIVNLFDLEGGKVEWLAAVGRRRVHVGPGVRFPLALMGNVDALRRGEPQVIDVDALPPSPDAEALLKSGVHVYMVVPMISRGELIGGLSFGGSSREFPPDQITIAEEVARQMAIAIDHSRLLERVTRYSGELEERVRERTLELSAANTQLQREVAERQRAEAEAERANRAKSEFLSRMSHELRTPLNSVIGFGQLLELGAQSPEQRESVGHILKGGRHLLALINEVLDLARIEAGKLSLSIEPVFLEDVVRGALDLVRPQAAARRVRLPEKLAWDRQVMADRQRLQQVLLNLLSNAIKYNREGGSIAVEHTEAPSGRTRFAIRDTGAGITPAMLERLFTPFDRLGADQSGVEGTGLGLALSKRLVEAMAGSLAVESRLGEGTTCTIELPTAVHAEVPAAASGDGPAVTERPCSRGTVLYIEDNLANLRLVERVVSLRPGVALLSAMQGRQGLELARAHRPDLIVLDLHLPDLPGTEVLAQLVGEPDTREIPVVILSADATPNQTARLRAQGAHAYLTKPLDVKALLALLDEVLT